MKGVASFISFTSMTTAVSIEAFKAGSSRNKQQNSCTGVMFSDGCAIGGVHSKLGRSSKKHSTRL